MHYMPRTTAVTASTSRSAKWGTNPKPLMTSFTRRPKLHRMLTNSITDTYLTKITAVARPYSPAPANQGAKAKAAVLPLTPKNPNRKSTLPVTPT